MPSSPPKDDPTAPISGTERSTLISASATEGVGDSTSLADEQQIRAQADRLLVARIRTGVPLVVAVIILAAVGDIVVGRPVVSVLSLVRLLQISTVLWGLWVLRKTEAAPRAVSTVLLGGAGLYLTTAVASVLTHDAVTGPVLLTALVFGTATVLPWGWRAQGAAVLTLVPPLLWVVYAVNGQLDTVIPFPGLPVIGILAGSVYVAYELERYGVAIARRDLALARSEARYRQIVDTAADVIYATDASGHATFFNPTASRILHFTQDELCGRHFLEFVRADARDAVARFYGRQFVKQVPSTYYEVPVVAKDGAELWLGQNVQLLMQDGVVTGFQSVARDVTERKRMEEALQQSEERFRGAFDHAPIGVALAALDGRFLQVNRSLCEMLGYSAAELTATSFQAITHPEDLDLDPHHVRQLLAGNMPFYGIEKRYFRKDGGVVQALLKVSVVRDPHGVPTHFIKQIEDITQCRQMEQALRDSEERFRTIAASAQDAIIMMDADDRVAFWNRAAEKIFGHAEAEVLGTPLHALLAPPESQESAARGLAGFRQTGCGAAVGKTLELTALRRGGERFPVELSVAAIRLGGRWHAVAIARDITARKQIEAELLRAKDAAEAATRAKSEFLANMSHEIRTPLNGVVGMTDLALATELTPEQREYLELAKTSADSLLAVINDILDFSKIEAGKLELETTAFRLRDSMGEAMKVLALRAHAKGLELLYDVPPDIPDTLTGDPSRVRQILVNLVGNAVKFTDRGEVALTVKIADPRSQISDVTLAEDRSDPSHITDPQSAIDLHFSVRDTGAGIAADNLRSIFNAFEQADASTTRKHGGTGLGLTICRRLVGMMGGRLWVESTVGVGSTFHFTARFGVGASVTAPLIEVADLRGLEVLVVDDNATNRRFLDALLRSWQLRPTVVDGGNAARAVLADAGAGQRFRLVLTDAEMPDMDGFELSGWIRSQAHLAPTRVILLSSGLQPDVERRRAAGIVASLMKPVKSSELLHAIHTALAGAPLEHQAGMDRRARPPAQKTAAAARGDVLHILVAEDNAVNQKLIVRLLEKRGHTVTAVGTGTGALRALDRQAFDLVLMDVQMPEMDGFEATAEIRRRERAGQVLRRRPTCLTRIPIIAMTAHAMKGDQERCLAVGMDAYVSKPIHVDELFDVIQGAVAAHDAGEAA